MGKLFTPYDLSSGFNNDTSLNANFSNIESALDKVLSRTGETPNQMEADLDMNSNDLLNVRNILLDSSLIEPRIVRGDYTLQASDLYRVLRVETASTITIPDLSTLKAGWYCHVQKATNQSVKFASAPGLTIEAVDNSREMLEYMGWCTLYKVSSNPVWGIMGNLA